MEYDREAARRRRDYEKALAAKAQLEEKLARLSRATRNAKSRLLATTKSEQWHRMTLGWLDREAGYTGEMAPARVWLRHQTVHEYVQLLAPHAVEMPDATNVAIEVAAVRANLADWSAKGEALLLDRAKRAYMEDLASFARWQREHPGEDGWRKKPATSAQGFLVSRTAATLGIDAPLRMTRGEAFDWLERHGGNLRLGGTDMPHGAAASADIAEAVIAPEARTAPDNGATDEEQES